jgi:hypothetical protein
MFQDIHLRVALAAENELSRNKDLICKKIVVRYHMVHIYRLLHTFGFKFKVSKKDLSILLQW